MPFDQVRRASSKASLLKRRESANSLYRANNNINSSSKSDSNSSTANTNPNTNANSHAASTDNLINGNDNNKGDGNGNIHENLIDKFQLNEIYSRIIGNSSVIIPETGETSHHHSFHLVPDEHDEPDSVCSSLLTNDPNQNQNQNHHNSPKQQQQQQHHFWQNGYGNADNGYLLPTTVVPTYRLSITQKIKHHLANFLYKVTSLLYGIFRYFASYCTQDILKCAIAYFIASLGVYCTPLSRILGQSDNKHLVATVAVYFHPSRTIGSMHQSIIFIAISLFYSFFVSFFCSALASYMFNIGEDEISYFINVIVVSIALSVVSVFKQKVGKQTFNVACSLASTSMISTIVKEGSRNTGEIPLDRLNSVFRIVVFGALISITLCYVLWPRSAKTALKQNLNESYYLMSDLLSLLSDKFLSGKDIHELVINNIEEQLKKNAKKLKSSLEETKYELLVNGREVEYHQLAKLVGSTIVLKRYLAGLKICTSMQHKLLEEYEEKQKNKLLAKQQQQQQQQQRQKQKQQLATSRAVSGALGQDFSIFGDRSLGLNMKSDFNGSSESIIADNANDHNDDTTETSSQQQSTSLEGDLGNNENAEEEDGIINAAQLFNLFIFHLGPPLKSFSYTLREILDNIPFDQNEPFLAVNTSQYFRSLSLARDLFNRKQLEVMKKVYNEKLFELIEGEKLKADEEEVAASCFNFAYSLIEYSTELSKVLEVVEDYGIYIENGRRSYEWLKFWKWGRSADAANISAENGNVNPKYTYVANEQRPRLNIFKPSNPNSQNNCNGDQTNTESVANNDANSNPLSKSHSASLIARIRYKAWRFFSLARRSDFQFGIRVGIGAFFLSSIAFFPQTKEFFANWRLEWALVIYSIMMNKSVGGTQMTVKWRIIGTFLGATVAVCTWELFSGEVWALALVGFIISIPSFYIILKWDKFNAYGRFILLTYNLTALYSYSMTQDEEEDDREGGNIPLIHEIGFHRFVSVSIGVIWAMFITTFVLPQSARSRLKKGLSLLWLQLGILWNSDPLKYKYKTDEYFGIPDNRATGNTEPNGVNINVAANNGKEFQLVGIHDNFHVYELFSELETLCSQAPMELRVKGPFDSATFKTLLNASETIINSIENINMIIAKDPVLTPGRAYVLDCIKLEREELEGRMLLNFYMIASAMKLGLPLPTKGVSTEHSKDRMLAKLAEVRKMQKRGAGAGAITEATAAAKTAEKGAGAGRVGVVENKNKRKSEEKLQPIEIEDDDFALVYSYVLLSSQIGEEIDRIIDLVKVLFEQVTPEELKL